MPHIGNIVGSHLPADIFARFCRSKGFDTVFIGGSDENGTPSEVAAQQLGITPKELCDVLYPVHKKIYDWLKISYDNFSRTSRKIHHELTQEIFLKIYKNGFISKGKLKLPYCEHCDRYLPDRYVEGTCPYCGYEHARGDQCEKCTNLLDPEQLIDPRCKLCGNRPEIREEEHLFFDINKLSDKLEKWIKSNKHWREQVRALALGWIKEGLKPRCITRNLKWGIKVPLKGFEHLLFYVWFDAPLGYVSGTKEWAENIGKPEEWEKYWKDSRTKIYHFIGKDNIPFHTIFWPGTLMAVGGFNLPWNVVGLQFLNYEGNKISKSRSWGIFCERLPESGLKSDIWRYYLTFLIPETKDTEFTWDTFKKRINNELVANIGNFIYRTLIFIHRYFEGLIPKPEKFTEQDEALIKKIRESPEKIGKLLYEVRLRDGLQEILSLSGEGNKYFQDNKPWELIKKDKKRCRTVLYVCANLCRSLAIFLSPYLPDASRKLWQQLNLKGNPERNTWDSASELNVKPNHKIKKPRILFEKLDEEKIKKVKKIVTKITPIEKYFKEEGDMISFKQFKKMEMKVGTVKKAEEVIGSKKLIKMQVDFGGETRQVVAGLKEHYRPEDLEGKQYVFVTNLEHAKFMGEESEAMILAAVEGKEVVLLKPEKQVGDGTRVE